MLNTDRTLRRQQRPSLVALQTPKHTLSQVAQGVTQGQIGSQAFRRPYLLVIEIRAAASVGMADATSTRVMEQATY